MTAPVVPTFSGPLPLKTDLPNYETNSQRFMNEFPGVIGGMNALGTYMNANMPTVTQLNAAVASAEESTESAAAAAQAAADAYDAFDDRFLGAKASNPTLDNDGDPLAVGSLYWNATVSEMRAWNGAAWVAASVANAVSRGGDEMTGPLEVPAGASGAQVPQAQEVALLASTQIGTSNVLINATGQIAQEALGSRTDDTYAEDGWSALTQFGAVTASTVKDAEDGTPFMMRLLQAQATPQRMGRLQIIEASRSKPCRGQIYTARFGRVRCSAAETVRYALLAWTGTADVVTSDVVNDWTSATYTPGNFFLASNLSVIATGSHALAANTLTDGVSLTGVVPSGCNNLILFSWTEAAVAQNVTLDLAKARINHGSVATPYKHEDDAEVLLACSRFKVPLDNRRPMGQAASASAVTSISVVVPVPMRVTPSISNSSHAFTKSDGGSTAGFTVTVTSMVGNTLRLDASGGSTLVAGNATIMVPAANTWLFALL